MRAIRTEQHGAWYPAVNTRQRPRPEVTLSLPWQGPVTDPGTGASLDHLTSGFYPGQLRALPVR